MRGPLRVLVVALVAAATAPLHASARGGLPDLPGYDLMIDSPYSWGVRPGAENPDDPGTPAGTWTITPSPIHDGVLDLRVRLEAPDVALPVEPGPAILFTSVGLGGGLPGDVGYGRHLSPSGAWCLVQGAGDALASGLGPGATTSATATSVALGPSSSGHRYRAVTRSGRSPTVKAAVDGSSVRRPTRHVVPTGSGRVASTKSRPLARGMVTRSPSAVRTDAPGRSSLPARSQPTA